MTAHADVVDAASDARGFARRVLGQGGLIVTAHASAQVLSFARNAILAHWLSKGDFGVAAAIVMLLQMVETLSDVGADRLIVQTRDGDDDRLLATAHGTLVARGVLTAALILLAAQPLAGFFAVPDAAWAFAAAAIAPALKGFMHLDSRRAQRGLDNRPQIAIEVVPQAAALVIVLPAILLTHSYASAVIVMTAQALASLAVSHLMARRPYELAADPSHLRSLVAFGWPIWASAIPLVAVYQGDRILIGHLLGMEHLASYTAAFMLTMVPGLLAAKLGTSLLLPLLAQTRDDDDAFAGRTRQMLDWVALLAAIYLAGFMVVGAPVLAIAFGTKYAGLGTLLGWLAAMWAMRMIQAVAGMALMARGITRPFLTAGIVRAAGLPLAFAALHLDFGLEGAAAAGAAAELAAMLYLAWRLDRLRLGVTAALGRDLLARAAFLVPLAALAWGALRLAGPDAGPARLAIALVGSVLLTLAAAVKLRPQLRHALLTALRSPSACAR